MVKRKNKHNDADAEIEAAIRKINAGTPLSASGVDKKIGKFQKTKAELDKKIIKLLLLGAGESGKSTIQKQLQIIHGAGFDHVARQSYQEKVWYNIYEGACALVRAAPDLDITITDKEVIDAGEKVCEEFDRINQNHLEGGAVLTPVFVKAIRTLWESPEIRQIYARNAEFQLQESFHRFADSLQGYPQWGGPKWIPSDEDILLCRVRTSGIVDQNYRINGNVFNIVDVGGQRNERRKWIGLFKDVTAMIYVAAMSGYDQRIFEDDETNRLKESLDEWETTANKSEFAQSALILFLNKFDIFQRKYYDEEKPIDCVGQLGEGVDPPPKKENEVSPECALARTWFIKLYKSRLQLDRKGKLFPHVTTALDEKNMSTVIGACAVHILAENMKLSGLVPKDSV